jgi:hypothetical protein
LHLTTRCLRQFIDELDLPRVGVQRESRPNVLLKFGLKGIRRVESRPQHYEGLDDLGALRVGLADDSDLGDGRMLYDAAFDVERADAVARRGDDVVVTADKEDMPLGVLLHRVTRQIPSPRP